MRLECTAPVSLLIAGAVAKPERNRIVKRVRPGVRASFPCAALSYMPATRISINAAESLSLCRLSRSLSSGRAHKQCSRPPG
jgi:hypothetical protein